MLKNQTSETNVSPRRHDLRVDVHGLAVYGRYPTLTDRKNLWAPVVDRTGALPLFCHALKLHFARAGLVRFNVNETRRLEEINETYTPVFSTGYLASDKDNTNPRLLARGIKCKMSRKFDATEICSKYKEITWAKDIQLEKLSICRMGILNIYKGGKCVGQGYEEIASVPLPGAPRVSTGPELKGETYEFRRSRVHSGTRKLLLDRTS